jgi:hypothetical protein
MTTHRVHYTCHIADYLWFMWRRTRIPRYYHQSIRERMWSME